MTTFDVLDKDGEPFASGLAFDMLQAMERALEYAQGKAAHIAVCNDTQHVLVRLYEDD